MPLKRLKFLTLSLVLLFSFEFAFSLNLKEPVNRSDLNTVISNIILQCEVSNKNKSKCVSENFIKSNLRQKGIKFDKKSLKKGINSALNSSKFEMSNESLSLAQIKPNLESEKENTNKKLPNSNKNSANTNKKEKIEIFFSDEDENSANNTFDDLANDENINLENNDLNSSNKKILFDFNAIQEISVRSTFSSVGATMKSNGGANKCNSCHEDKDTSNDNADMKKNDNVIELDEIRVTAYADDTADSSWRDNVIDVISMFLTRGALKNTGLNRQRLLITKTNPKALMSILQELHKEQIINLFENGADHIYIGNNKYVAKEVKTGQKGAKIFSDVSNNEVFRFFMETAGAQKMPKLEKVYENGVFKGNRYTIETPNGNYNLRDYSTNPAPDGSKFNWTFDVPRELFGKNSGKKTYEIKFE